MATTQAGNVPFVTEGGFGAFSRNPTKIAETVSRWLRDDELRAEMSKKAKAASRPEVCPRDVHPRSVFCDVDYFLGPVPPLLSQYTLFPCVR